jgi:hypothetical protein
VQQELLRHSTIWSTLDTYLQAIAEQKHAANEIVLITSFCRRHDVDRQLYLTQLLMNLPHTKMSELSDWLPDHWRIRHPARIATFTCPPTSN